MLVLYSGTTLEYFCPEGFAHQSLKKFRQVKMSFLLKINGKKEKQELE